MADSSGLNLSFSRIYTPAYPESNQTPLGTFAASAFESLSGTAVLEYGPTEILPSVGAISKYSARRCRPRRHISRAHPREPWGSRPTKATSPRETDSPQEGRVRSESFSESENSLLAGNIQGISSIRRLSRTPIADKKQLSQPLTNQFPTHLNRELFWPLQGIKSDYLGTFRADQGIPLPPAHFAVG